MSQNPELLIIYIIALIISLIMFFAQVRLFSINRTLLDILRTLQLRNKSDNTRKCPYCAEFVKFEAILCKYCRSDLTEENKIEYWQNRNKKSESEYRFGKLHGKVICWYESGAKKNEIEYKSGRLNGKYLEWDENGMKIKEMEFKDDEMIKDYLMPLK